MLTVAGALLWNVRLQAGSPQVQKRERRQVDQRREVEDFQRMTDDEFMKKAAIDGMAEVKLGKMAPRTGERSSSQEIRPVLGRRPHEGESRTYVPQERGRST
jgi:hypothetical protein